MEVPKRGLKRKRDTSQGFMGGDSKIIGKLHHGMKEVKKAAKKAKTFETQRLVKKLKGLRKDEAVGSDIAEHEAQLRIIKTIDHEILANIAVKSKFVKDHLLSQHESVNEALSQVLGNKMPSTIPQGTTGKAYGRILSSKVLAAEVSSLRRTLHELLGHEATSSAETVPHGSLNFRKNSMTGKTTPPELISAADPEAVAQWESDSESDKQADSTHEELPSIDEDDSNYPQVESSEDEDGDGEGEGDSSMVSKFGQSATLPSGVESTFLPSLSVGFIRGSDESDWSDNEAQVADPGKKKNRRGQRARQAIWEKKYGRNANHKKKELEALHKYPRMFSEDNKLRSGPGQRDGKRRGIREGNTKRTPHSNRTHSPDSHQPTKKYDDRPLHPSWAAKRQMKEKQTPGIVPSQGTKIKFTE